MFAQLGFDGYFFGRLDWMDKNARLKNKTAEFIWNANPSLGIQTIPHISKLTQAKITKPEN